MRALLEEEGTEVANPKECLETAYHEGWIKDGKVYLSMLKDRNLSSHCYDQNVSQQIFRRIKSEYVRAFEKALKGIEERKGSLCRLKEPEAFYEVSRRVGKVKTRKSKALVS